MVRLPCSCQFKYKPYSFSNRVAKTILPRTSSSVGILFSVYQESVLILELNMDFTRFKSSLLSSFFTQKMIVSDGCSSRKV